MVSTNPYAALDNAALQTLAQLRGLSPDGDNMQILERMTAQDRATGTSVKVAAEAPVDAKKRDSVADEAGWEIAGAHNKRKSKSSSAGTQTPNEEAECPQDTVAIEAEDDAVPMAKDDAPAPEPVTVDGSKEETTAPASHAAAPDSKEVSSESAKEESADSPKKKRKRGKKGGKKVNKKTATPPENILKAPTDEVPLEVQKLAFEPVDCLVGKEAPEAIEDSQEAPADKRSTEAQEPANDATNPIQTSEDHHDAAIDEIPDELHQPAIETLTPIDVSGVSDNLLDDVAPIVEQSPSVAPTEIGEPVDLQIVLDLEQMEKDEALGDMQAPISQNIDALMHPEHTTIAPQETLADVAGPAWETLKKKNTREKRHSPSSKLESAASDEASMADDEEGGSTAPMPGERSNLRAWSYDAMDSPSESSTFEPSTSGSSTSIVEDASPKKKNRKRGNQGGKKVPKKKAPAQSGGLKFGTVSVAMVVAAVIAAGLGFALGKR